MKKVIIAQARLSSSRLPRKVLADLNGKTVIEHIIRRLEQTRGIDEICFAIPASPEEDELADVLAKYDVTPVRGSAYDVLGRFMQAAFITRADIIVRITADNPLISIEEIERQVEYLEQNPEVDYVITDGYPMGITPEAFRTKTLEKLDFLARHAQMREHVTLYLRENPASFAPHTLKAPPDCADTSIKLSLDTQADYELMQEIYRQLGHQDYIDLKSVLQLIRDDQGVASLCQTSVQPATA